MSIEVVVDDTGKEPVFILRFKGTRHTLEYRLTDAEAVQMARQIIHASPVVLCITNQDAQQFWGRHGGRPRNIKE